MAVFTIGNLGSYAGTLLAGSVRKAYLTLTGRDPISFPRGPNTPISLNVDHDQIFLRFLAFYGIANNNLMRELKIETLAELQALPLISVPQNSYAGMSRFFDKLVDAIILETGTDLRTLAPLDPAVVPFFSNPDKSETGGDTAPTITGVQVSGTTGSPPVSQVVDYIANPVGDDFVGAPIFNPSTVFAFVQATDPTQVEGITLGLNGDFGLVILCLITGPGPSVFIQCSFVPKSKFTNLYIYATDNVNQITVFEDARFFVAPVSARLFFKTTTKLGITVQTADFVPLPSQGILLALGLEAEAIYADGEVVAETNEPTTTYTATPVESVSLDPVTGELLVPILDGKITIAGNVLSQPYSAPAHLYSDLQSLKILGDTPGPVRPTQPIPTVLLPGDEIAIAVDAEFAVAADADAENDTDHVVVNITDPVNPLNLLFGGPGPVPLQACAQAPGTVTLRSTLAPVVEDVIITVTAPPSVTMTVTATMTVGDMQVATLIGNYPSDPRDLSKEENGTTWSTSNAAVATVSVDGVITAVAIGSAVITGSNSSKFDSKTITVS